MRNFFNSITFKILLGLACVAAGLMVYSVANPGSITLSEKIITVVATPFQRLGANIAGTASNFWEGLTSGNRLQKENQELKNEINQLKDKLVDYENNKNENERLKELLDLKETYPTIELVDADVVARDTDDYGTSFTIGKGTNAGIKERDAVMTSSGLVGVVTEVYPTSAKVTTLLSTDLKVGAKIVRTRDTGVVSGVTSWALEGTMKLSYISRDSSVSEGDIVVTSGASDLYPPDLKIGDVKSVHTEQNGTSLYAVVALQEEAHKIKNVFVITDFKSGGEK